MSPEYVARKSVWKAITKLRFFLLVLFLILMGTGFAVGELASFLAIPFVIVLIVIACDMIRLKCERVEFYSDKIVSKSGVFSRHERQSVFAGVYAVSIDQSFGGRIFRYGDLKVDVVGKWDANLHGVADPDGLKAYLETKIVPKSAINAMVFE